MRRSYNLQRHGQSASVIPTTRSGNVRPRRFRLGGRRAEARRPPTTAAGALFYVKTTQTGQREIVVIEVSRRHEGVAKWPILRRLENSSAGLANRSEEPPVFSSGAATTAKMR